MALAVLTRQPDSVPKSSSSSLRPVRGVVTGTGRARHQGDQSNPSASSSPRGSFTADALIRVEAGGRQLEGWGVLLLPLASSGMAHC